MKTKIGWAFLPLVTGRLAPPGRGMVPTEDASNYFPESVEGMVLKKHSDLRVLITPPQNTSYEAVTFGPSARSVGIRPTNSGSKPVDIARVGAVFTAKRDAVEFECKTRLPDEVVQEHEPSWLPLRESYSRERDIDCLMPLPGRYEIGAYITFDESSTVASADFAETFAFDVLRSPRDPRAYPSRDGLYVIMAGARATLPLSPEAWARGGYHVVIAIINGGSKPVVASRARLTFLSYRGDSSLPCSGAAELLSFPVQLEPGTMVTMATPVACAPSEEGTYEIVGHLDFGKYEAEIEIGHVALTVTSDPTLFTPGFRLWPTELSSPTPRSSLIHQRAVTE